MHLEASQSHNHEKVKNLRNFMDYRSNKESLSDDTLTDSHQKVCLGKMLLDSGMSLPSLTQNLQSVPDAPSPKASLLLIKKQQIESQCPLTPAAWPGGSENIPPPREHHRNRMEDRSEQRQGVRKQVGPHSTAPQQARREGGTPKIENKVCSSAEAWMRP